MTVTNSSTCMTKKHTHTHTTDHVMIEFSPGNHGSLCVICATVRFSLWTRLHSHFLSPPPHPPTTPSALTADWWRAVSATLTHCINFMSQNTSGDSGDNTHTLPSGFPIPSSGSGNYCKESLHWSHIQHKLSIHTDCSLYASLGSTVALKHSSLINHQCTLK